MENLRTEKDSASPIETLSRLATDLKSHRRLENEPKLFTRSEVMEFMNNALTLYELSGKRPKDSELEELIP